MKVIVDSNILFSALLHSHTSFGKIIFSSKGIFEFYAPKIIDDEIKGHWEKLSNLSKLAHSELLESYSSLLSKITLVPDHEIPSSVWRAAEQLMLTVDIDDTDFVALTIHLQGHLWTGDKILSQGLQKTGYEFVLNTSEISKIWQERQ